MLQLMANNTILTGMDMCVFAAGLFNETQRWLLPLRIPATEIKTLAGELIAEFGQQASEIEEINQDRAWDHSDPYEQGKWRRVARAIRHMQK